MKINYILLGIASIIVIIVMSAKKAKKKEGLREGIASRGYCHSDPHNPAWYLAKTTDTAGWGPGDYCWTAAGEKTAYGQKSCIGQVGLAGCLSACKKTSVNCSQNQVKRDEGNSCAPKCTTTDCINGMRWGAGDPPGDYWNPCHYQPQHGKSCGSMGITTMKGCHDHCLANGGKKWGAVNFKPGDRGYCQCRKGKDVRPGDHPGWQGCKITNAPNPAPKAEGEVKCRFTVDNVVDEVKYNGKKINYTGNSRVWSAAKEFSFTPVPGGLLEIKGHETRGVAGCKNSGLQLECESSKHPKWNRWGSNEKDWKTGDGRPVCISTSAFYLPGAKGYGKKIWDSNNNVENRWGAVTLVGAPGGVDNLIDVKVGPSRGPHGEWTGNTKIIKLPSACPTFLLDPAIKNKSTISQSCKKCPKWRVVRPF